MVFRGFQLILDLTSIQLQEYINYGLQNAELEPLRIDLPLFDEFKVSINQPRITRLSFLPGRTQKIRLQSHTELALKVESPSKVIPSFQGVILLVSNLTMTPSSSWFDLEYSIVTFKWTKPPVNLRTGKKLRMIKKVSGIIINGFSVVENRIEHELRELAGNTQIGSWISKILPQTNILGLDMHWDWINIGVSSIGTEDQRLLLQSQMSFELRERKEVMPETKVVLTLELQPKSHFASMNFHESEITEMINHHLGHINQLTNKQLVKIEKVLVKSSEDSLSFLVHPRQPFDVPFNINISVVFDQDVGRLELIHFSMLPVEKTGWVVKAAFRILRSKVETAINNYFPIRVINMIAIVYKQVAIWQKEFDVPFLITIPEFDIEQIGLKAKMLTIRGKFAAKLVSPGVPGDEDSVGNQLHY